MTCPAPQVECSQEDCHEPARRSGLCWGHLKQRQRKQVLGEKRERGRGLKAVFLESIYDLVEVDASDKRQWDLAWKRVRMAARRYVKARKPHDRYR